MADVRGLFVIDGFREHLIVKYTNKAIDKYASKELTAFYNNHSKNQPVISFYKKLWGSDLIDLKPKKRGITLEDRLTEKEVNENSSYSPFVERLLVHNGSNYVKLEDFLLYFHPIIINPPRISLHLIKERIIDLTKPEDFYGLPLWS